MDSESMENQYIEVSGNDLNLESSEAEASTGTEPMCFQSYFEDFMEMNADVETVANYLNAHQGWFRRCAQPMSADPLGEMGYALTIGRFGSFGYQVEPKIGLELLPPDEGIYRIRTVPIPGYVAPGYEVDFKASMRLNQVSPNEPLPNGVTAITRVMWDLDLAVYLRFPKFIYKFSKSLLQTTGDRILCQIVRQVSRRLTYKVQSDFHSQMGLPMPKTSKKPAKNDVNVEIDS